MQTNLKISIRLAARIAIIANLLLSFISLLVDSTRLSVVVEMTFEIFAFLFKHFANAVKRAPSQIPHSRYEDKCGELECLFSFL